MNTLLFLSHVSLAADTADFATEHPRLNGMLEAIGEISNVFGNIANSLCKIPTDIPKNDISLALEGIAAGLLTFFMVLEIITFCFNVDFHAGFESAMRIAVKTILMFIIVENVKYAVGAAIEIFKFDNDLDFSESFKTIVDPIKDMFSELEFSTGIIMKHIEPIMYGIILVFIILAVIVLFSMIIISMVGIVMETAILTVVSPVACSTLVNSQVRQTGISAIKNIAAISLQWSVISLSFTVYNSIAEKVNGIDISALAAIPVIGSIIKVLPPFLCLAALAAMIAKSGEITRRALGS